MRIGIIIKENQESVYYKLNRHRKRHKRRKKENITFSEAERLMRHDSYKKAPGGAFRQKTWGE